LDPARESDGRGCLAQRDGRAIGGIDAELEHEGGACGGVSDDEFKTLIAGGAVDRNQGENAFPPQPAASRTTATRHPAAKVERGRAPSVISIIVTVRPSQSLDSS
jgi:hypothetical protein